MRNPHARARIATAADTHRGSIEGDLNERVARCGTPALASQDVVALRSLESKTSTKMHKGHNVIS